MILLDHHLLTVRFPTGTAKVLDLQEVHELLVNHPELAHYCDSWILEKAIESILGHLRSKGEESISIQKLIRLIRELVDHFLYEIVGAHSLSRLDLHKLARDMDGFELNFFPAVKQFLQKKLAFKESPSEANPSPGRKKIEMTGLRDCAKILSRRHRWSKRCSEVQEELVSYVRQEAAKWRVPHLSIVILS